MKYKNFYSYEFKTRLNQVTKTTAKKLFDSGEKIIIKPSRVFFGSFWCNYAIIKKSSGADFEKICNSFIYYNCNSETGKYLQYFVKVK